MNMTDTFKQRIVAYLSDLGNSRSAITNPNRKDNKSKYLFDIFIWQTAYKFAGDKLEKAWTQAQTDGVIDSDETLRSMDKSDEHIVSETNNFSCVVKLDKPRETFNRNLFIETVAKKYKINVVDLLVIADACKDKGKAPLHKRVLEAE